MTTTIAKTMLFLRFLTAVLAFGSISAFTPAPQSKSSLPSTASATNIRPVLFSTSASGTTTPTNSRALPPGISKTITVEGVGRPVRTGDVVLVKYVCTANSDSDSNAFARADRQRVLAGDGTMIPAWDHALRSMREGERAAFRVSDPRHAYGEVGVPPFVPPNAEIDMDVEILSVEEAAGFLAGADGASSELDAGGVMAMDGPINRPRTPGAIAAAYEQKMRQKALTAPPEKEGIEWVVDKIRSSYFFGLFEGETGQEAPWYLKPSITFPLAFLVVGAAFYASLVGGAISERGMPTTDELDEIIIASSSRVGLEQSLVLAMNMFVTMMLE
ncbi:hypothetical protein ACHAXS_002592 [Conticribra weissflogii]